MANLLYGAYGPDDKYMDQWNKASASTRAYMVDPNDQARWKSDWERSQAEKNSGLWGNTDPFDAALGAKGPTTQSTAEANTTANSSYTGAPPGTTATNSPIGQPTPAPSTGQWWNQPYTPAPTPNTGGVFNVTSPTPSLTSGNSPITGGVNTQPAPGVPTMSKVGFPTGNMAGITTGMANTANKAVTTPGIAGGMQTLPGNTPTTNTTNNTTPEQGTVDPTFDQNIINQFMEAEVAYERGKASSSESGNWDPNYEAQIRASWVGLTPEQAFQRALNSGNSGLTNSPFGDVILTPDSPYIQQFQQKFPPRTWTDPEGNLIEQPDSGNITANGVYLMGYGDGPHYDNVTGDLLMQDPSRVMRLPDGRYIWEAGNINTQEIVGAQRARETDSRRMRQRGLMMAAAVLGGGLAYGAYGAGAAGAGAGADAAATGYGLGGAAGEAAATGGMGGMGAGSTLIPTAGMLAESAVPAGMTAADLMGPVTVNGLTSAGAGGILGTGITGSQLLSGARTAMSGVGLANNLLNGGGGGSTNGGGSTLGNILTGALGTGATNHNLGKYEDRVDALINRSDPYGPYRQKGIEGLHKLVDNPGALASNPLFSAMQDKSDMNLQRVMAARGYLGSGNEMGALHENFSANLNKFYGEEFNRYARMAGIDMKPSTEAGIVSAGVGAATRQSRNAGIASFVNSNGGLGGVFNLINSWLNSDGEQPLTDDQFDSWWNNFTGSLDDVEFPTGDAGDYNG